MRLVSLHVDRTARSTRLNFSGLSPSPLQVTVGDCGKMRFYLKYAQLAWFTNSVLDVARRG
jgi:hypothetical protein